MRRRDLIKGLGGSAVAWPLRALAQQPTIPVIGFVSGGSPDTLGYLVSAFRQGLSDTGYVEGRNVAIEFRWAEGQYDRLPSLLADLVQHQVTVLVATTTPGALAAKAATNSIPTVFATDGDPVRLGLVASLSRPGGNVTGVTQLNVEVASKRVELVHELIPAAHVIALLVNPTNPLAQPVLNDSRAATSALGLQFHIVEARNEGDFEGALKAATDMHADAVIIASADPLFGSRAEQLGALALHHRLPAIYQFRRFAVAGGLASYGGDFPDSYRQVGIYTGRILKGEKPADLPVQQSTKLELILNLKTAKTLGLNIPQSLLATADEVIE